MLFRVREPFHFKLSYKLYRNLRWVYIVRPYVIGLAQLKRRRLMVRANTIRKVSTQKASRFSIRASATQKRVIAEAARIKDTTISDFVLEQSLTAAQQIIADQVQFRLPKKQWKVFCDALDAPPKTMPALRRLLTKPGLFDANR